MRTRSGRRIRFGLVEPPTLAIAQGGEELGGRGLGDLDGVALHARVAAQRKAGMGSAEITLGGDEDEAAEDVELVDERGRELHEVLAA
eukprot:9782393-Heterocapsa_arctica.AAC.1